MKSDDEIYTKQINGAPTKGCLVLEGGAFRGIYTAGVLDCFLEHHLFIDTVYGISAGALNGSNYLAGNYGRSALLILEHRKNSHYLGLDAYKESGSLVGFKFMFEDLNEEYPLNEERLFSDDHTLNIGCTNLNSGEVEYFDNHLGRELFYDALRASASIPLISKQVEIMGQPYLDGGCKTKLPISYALKRKEEKIIFIGTREAKYRRRNNRKENELIEVAYHKYPNFIDSFKNANNLYNQDCDLIDELVKKNKIFRIVPSMPVTISRFESSVKKLSDLYFLGYRDGENNFTQLIRFLSN